jgi:hypothetical protein
VTSVIRYDETARGHNLTSGTLHTYYVLAGKTPVLAHNLWRACQALSDQTIDTYVLPLHGPGTPAKGSKFTEDVDPDHFEAKTNEAVSGSPIPSEVDSVSGNHAHDFNFGQGSLIGEKGETGVRVWG